MVYLFFAEAIIALSSILVELGEVLSADRLVGLVEERGCMLSVLQRVGRRRAGPPLENSY